MPPGKEDRVDGAENFMARILDENMFSARNPADEFLLRVSPDAEIMVRRAEKNGAPDGFGRAGRKDFTGDSGGFGGTLFCQASQESFSSAYQLKLVKSVAQEEAKSSFPL